MVILGTIILDIWITSMYNRVYICCIYMYCIYIIYYIHIYVCIYIYGKQRDDCMSGTSTLSPFWPKIRAV